MPFPPDAPNLIGERLESGRLPRDAPAKMYAGYGRGYRCDGCDQTILPAQVEYEFEGDGRTIRFHLGCAGIWEAERRRRGWLKSD
jgi:hypothetical protein